MSYRALVKNITPVLDGRGHVGAGVDVGEVARAACQGGDVVERTAPGPGAARNLALLRGHALELLVVVADHSHALLSVEAAGAERAAARTVSRQFRLDLWHGGRLL